MTRPIFWIRLWFRSLEQGTQMRMFIHLDPAVRHWASMARVTSTLLVFGGGLCLSVAAQSQGTVEPPIQQALPSGWKSSPFHGVIGGDGNVIPCRCLFRGHAYMLGQKVCMNTHMGVVMAECDLQQNNTSWVPTTEVCTTS